MTGVYALGATMLLILLLVGAVAVRQYGTKSSFRGGRGGWGGGLGWGGLGGLGGWGGGLGGWGGVGGWGGGGWSGLRRWRHSGGGPAWWQRNPTLPVNSLASYCDWCDWCDNLDPDGVSDMCASCERHCPYGQYKRYGL